MADKVIQITADQRMTIPYGLTLGVQGDNEITRLYFSCIRYPSDGVDLSEFTTKYFTYITPNGIIPTPFLVENEKTNDDDITFEVPVTGGMTQYAGNVGIGLCFKKGDLDWNVHNSSLRCMSGYHVENPVQQYPDLAQQITTFISQGGTVLHQLTNMRDSLGDIITEGNAVIARNKLVNETATESADRAESFANDSATSSQKAVEAVVQATKEREQANEYRQAAETAAQQAAGYAGESEYRFGVNPSTGHPALFHYSA
jgi:hypothetical protein